MNTDGDYPELWKRGLIQQRVRELAGHRCEGCGMPFNQGTNIATCHVRRDGRPVVGTVHHIDHNPANCSMRNLVYLCQTCHMFVQHRWRPGDYLPLEWRNDVPSWIVARGLPYRFHPQMVLIEVEATCKAC